MTAPTVELSMIVKDGAASLKRCLESVCDVVDRIVVGDTGSTDGSMDIARSFDAKVITVPWKKNFASARNCVLRHSRCDWILILDADEILDRNASHTFLDAVAYRDVFAYDVWRWNYVLETYSRSGEQGALANPYRVEASRPYPAYVKSLNTRLFRRHPGVYFERSVHENVTGRIETLGLGRVTASFVIHHFGLVEDSRDARNGKNELYQQMGKDNLQCAPDDVRTYFELGLGELEHYKRPESALEYFLQALRVNSNYAPACLFAGICLIRMRRLADALLMLRRSERLDSTSIVLQESLGDAYFYLGDYSEAIMAYASAQSLGGASALIEAKLGACKVSLGQKDQGMELVMRALKREPNFAELYDVASTTAFLAGRVEMAAELATQRIEMDTPVAFNFILAAALTKFAGNPARGHAFLEKGLTLFPEDRELRQALSADQIPEVSREE